MQIYVNCMLHCSYIVFFLQSTFLSGYKGFSCFLDFFRISLHFPPYLNQNQSETSGKKTISKTSFTHDYFEQARVQKLKMDLNKAAAIARECNYP